MLYHYIIKITADQRRRLAKEMTLPQTYTVNIYHIPLSKLGREGVAVKVVLDRWIRESSFVSLDMIRNLSVKRRLVSRASSVTGSYLNKLCFALISMRRTMGDSRWEKSPFLRRTRRIGPGSKMHYVYATMMKPTQMIEEFKFALRSDTEEIIYGDFDGKGEKSPGASGPQLSGGKR